MVLRIERISDGQVMILKLSGRLQSEHVEGLKEQIEGRTERVILDMGEVKLVDREVVRFLGVCEANGVELSQCSPYIREWIDRERGSQGDF
jgi:anti-anti-sigma regulatory factor